MEKTLKIGDKVKMRVDTPSYKQQGDHMDGTRAIGTIYQVNGSDNHYYGVNWDNGRTGFTYDDRHVEFYEALPEIINSYQIY